MRQRCFDCHVDEEIMTHREYDFGESNWHLHNEPLYQDKDQVIMMSKYPMLIKLTHSLKFL